MPLIRSHWVWLTAILLTYSVWDWYEHISRPGSAFEQAPGAWFGFTAASVGGLLLIAWGVSQALQRAKLPELAASALGVAIAVAAHLTVTGPLWDAIFWDGGLRFDAVATPSAIAAGLYLAFRAVFALFERVTGAPPPSRA